MEEVQVIDCPPTPEILLPSSTPPSSSLLDALDSSSSAEEVDVCTNRTEDASNESGRFSPPPKCAICLGKCRQKCYTDSCRHQFCYRCLLEWSKIKAECPLCKQVFRSIIYKQKTFGRYEEHIISIVPPASPPSTASGPGIGPTGGGTGRAPPQVYHRLDFTLSQTPRFTYSATLRVQPSQSERLQQLFLHQSGDVQRFSREYPDDSIPSRQNGPEWRRYIYHRRLHARPLPDINGRFRECSAAFYRENPAQIHRLMPWINRELIALCRGNPAQVTLIMENFTNLLMTHDITSPAFRERVSYWGRTRSVHFIHELLNFARSPYDMIGYDRCVQYDPYQNNVVVLSSSSSSSSGSSTSSISEASDGEDDVVRIVEPAPGTSAMVESVGTPGGNRNRGRTQFTIETRSSDQTVIMTGSFGGAGVSGIVSVSTSGTQTSGPSGSNQNNNSNNNNGVGFPDMSRIHPLTSLAPQTVSRLEDGANISLSSSDSDDCRIVGALKPPHLRTPEMVSLESESDSDVVFVNEDENRREPTAESQNLLFEDLLFPNNTFEQDASTKLEERSGASASEYNNGASTSSGGGGGGGGGGMKKYYTKPRMNRYSGGTGVKSIYEASESEKSEAPTAGSESSESSSHEEFKFNIRNQSTTTNRRRKAVKRRPPADSSDHSVGEQKFSSDEEFSSSSSSFSSSSSSSDSADSDSEFQSDKPTKSAAVSKRSRKSKLHALRKSKKRHQSETKKRTKVKQQKSSSTKNSRKRQRLSPKSSNSCLKSDPSTSISPVDALPESSNAVLKIHDENSTTGKRKLRSAVVKPDQQPSGSSPPKKRKKVPICSELITSTDFSTDDERREPVQRAPIEPVPASVPSSVVSTCSEVVSSDEDSSDSEEQCTIASLIRASQHPMVGESEQHLERQNTSTASTGSNSSNNSRSSNSSTNSNSSTVASGSERSIVETSHLQLEQPDVGPSSPGFEDDSVAVPQMAGVGAEVEL
ncbi:E3 ubiquitin-protein ligase Topors [Malaya genurostris]|uniref:E3 ubiquitin-protein ligase Topors n=1 Tax=Malaya genurostris TaxID=325434 RepID=UPI0026F4008D|nr:E3 ubiquitin-protein ligase Topors [Malaya genurostris]